MNFFKRQWERFKAKSVWGKLSDGLFVVLIIVLLTNDGRIFFQRLILQTGLFGSFIENEHEPVSQENWSFPIQDLDGNQYELADFRGRKVFLNFWATWCPPCNAEIPGMMKLMEACDETPTAFILVTREPSEKVKRFIQGKKWDIPVYFTNVVPIEEMAYTSLPTTFIINEEGVLIHSSSGARKWNDDDTKEYFGCN